MITNSQVTIDAGLKENRLSMLIKSIDKRELIAIIVLQITDLIEFIGLSGKMSAKQIFDTAEFIVDDYCNFSLMGLQHCFNLIKKSEPPFDDKLYNSISGKKIIEWLRRYDAYVDNYIFDEANRKLERDQMRALDREISAGDKLLSVALTYNHI